MEITQYIGIAGAVTYLLSYFLLQLGKIDGNGNFYAALNMLAAIFVTISLTTHFNIGSLIIQVSFISLSLYAIFRSFWMRRHIQLAPLEQELAGLLFPDLPPRQALPLIRTAAMHQNIMPISRQHFCGLQTDAVRRACDQNRFHIHVLWLKTGKVSSAKI